MMTVGLQTPKEFLTHVVGPDMAEFSAPGQAELRLAYHACISLFSLRDWVSQAQDGNPWIGDGVAYPIISANRPGVFATDLCRVEPGFEVIADIANATKHMVLDRGLTSLYGAANVHISTLSVSSSAPASPPSPARTLAGKVLVQIGPDFIDVLDNATKVHDMWKRLFAQNGW